MATAEAIRKVARASATGGGNYIKQGKGTLVVSKVIFPKLFKGDTFIAEFKVKYSESFADAVDSKGKVELANAIGSTCSFVQTMDKAAAPGAVKGFIEKLDGDQAATEDEFAELLMMYVNEDPKAGEVNPGRGREINYETYQGTIRGGPNAGKDITKVRWSHVELTDKQIEANRNWLDGKVKAA